MKNNASEKKVLVIDDDADIVESIGDILNMEGYTVRSTTDGDEGLDIAGTFQPDVILLDLLLAGKDGALICQSLKQKEQTAAIPIVMMSAHPTAKEQTAAVGADDFITKPFELLDLLGVIQKHIVADSR